MISPQKRGYFFVHPIRGVIQYNFCASLSCQENTFKGRMIILPKHYSILSDRPINENARSK